MGELQQVCSMCGDVGFPDQLFRCNSCFTRFQHWYCSSHYSEYVEPSNVCDWCQSERSRRNQAPKQLVAASSSKGSQIQRRISNYDGGRTSRSLYSAADAIKQTPAAADHGKYSQAAGPPTRPATRRYKLLKDVMC